VLEQTPMKTACFAAFLFAISISARTDTVKLKCTADTNVSSYPGEQRLNYGASNRLRLKGIQMFALMKFDTAPIAGWQASSAKLHFRYAGADRKLRTIGISTISVDWQEGTGTGTEAPDQTCFAHPNGANTTWAGAHTDLTDVTFTAGGTIAAYRDVAADADGWMTVEIPANIVNAMISGATYGIAITDEKGQTAANNDIYSREQNASAPYLEVTGSPGARKVPTCSLISAKPDAAHADFDTGSAVVSLRSENAFSLQGRFHSQGAADWIAISQRFLPAPGRCANATLRLSFLPPSTKAEIEVTPVSAAGVLGTPQRITIQSSPAVSRPTPLQAEGHQPGSPLMAGDNVLDVFPETAKIDPITGHQLLDAGNLSLLHQGTVHLQGMPGETVGMQLALRGTGWRGDWSIAVADIAATPEGRRIKVNPQLFQAWYVKDGAWLPEDCIPITNQRVTIPRKDNPVSGQTTSAIYLDLFIPPTAAPGIYTTALTIPGAPVGKVPLQIQVGSVPLPVRPSFIISLNTYGTVGGDFGLDDRTPEYRTLEREYHRLCYLHRAALAPLGYSHSGTLSSNYAPPTAGSGSSLHVTDWSSWDAQFGPYLDGSAFAGLPVAAAPISHLYLPFHEAWPVDIRQHYRYQQTVTEYPALITEHAMKAGPIDELTDDALKSGFEAVSREYARHFADKGWTQTDLQFYQNDKYYYKDPRQGGRGTSWWLLDEPNHRDDWLALAFFNRRFRSGVGAAPKAKFVIREDISRPQWQRDYLDGLVDMMCVSNELFTHQPRIKQFQEQGVKMWNYGSAAPATHNCAEIEAWALFAWLYGADGLVPWQTVGNDHNFEVTEDTALLLPGKRFGLNGPIASVRLKAMRRAEQDVEYLQLLQHKMGWTREQVAAALINLLPKPPVSSKKSDDDAGTYLFQSADNAQMGALRAALFHLLNQ
jgi:Domain of unknown function (DUF4091)